MGKKSDFFLCVYLLIQPWFLNFNFILIGGLFYSSNQFV